MTNSCNTILVIEDEDNIRIVIEYNLKRQGFDVYAAGDGLSGLELARKVLPNIVLLDWMMPEMDGLEVLTELKRDPITADIPVLMLTAKGMVADIEKALELGADDYITKPFDPTSLGRTITEKLHKQAEQTPAAKNADQGPDTRDTSVGNWS